MKMMKYYPEGAKKRKRLTNPTTEMLDTMIASGEILEGTVTRCSKDLDLIVEFGDWAYGVVKPTETDATPQGDGTVKGISILSCVGKCITFKVTGYHGGADGKLIAELSRKAAQLECIENYVSKMKPGDIIPVHKTYVEDYGVFCDVGCGLAGLLPIENFSISRVGNPKKWLQGINDFYAVVKCLDPRGRPLLSHKELLGTWEEEMAHYEVGETVIGIVRTITPYGIFIELTPNLTGLAEPTEDIHQDDVVSVHIKSCIKEKMKIKLNIISKLAGDPNDMYLKSLKYKMNSGNISQWVYSPENCERTIKTIFSTEAE